MLQSMGSQRTGHNWVAELSWAMGFSYMPLIVFSYVPSIPTLMHFYHEWMLNFVKCIFCIYWEDYVIFILCFVNGSVFTSRVSILNHPCIPGINHTWSWSVMLFIYCWIQFANILLRIFTSVFRMKLLVVPTTRFCTISWSTIQKRSKFYLPKAEAGDSYWKVKGINICYSPGQF